MAKRIYEADMGRRPKPKYTLQKEGWFLRQRNWLRIRYWKARWVIAGWELYRYIPVYGKRVQKRKQEKPITIARFKC